MDEGKQGLQSQVSISADHNSHQRQSAFAQIDPRSSVVDMFTDNFEASGRIKHSSRKAKSYSSRLLFPRLTFNSAGPFPASRIPLTKMALLSPERRNYGSGT